MSPRERPSGARPPLALVFLLALVGVWLLAAVLDLTLTKSFSVDEFEYAHGAWLISKGEVIYRDFFEAHFPLIHQVMALPWLFLRDEPVNILVLRVAMLPFLLLMAGAAGAVNRRVGPLTAWTTPLVLLATASLVGMGLEIRPDTLAFSLFLSAVAVLCQERLAPKARGFLAGVLAAAAAWGSQKVVYYGVVLVAALVADLIAHRRGREDRFLGDWRAFVAGAATVATAIAAYLTVTGSWAAWIRWSLAWVAGHQRFYPGFPWTRNFLPFFAYHTWLFALGAVGLVWTLRRLARRRGAADPDLLLVGLLVATLASAAWQTAGYVYSFIPFAATLGIFAARGITATYRYFGERRRERPTAAVFGIALVSLLLVGEAAHVRTLYMVGGESDNRSQLETLRLLGELTAPGDPVFDIAGKRVARPGVHFFYFTDAVIRAHEVKALAEEIPAAIVSKGATAYLHDERWPSLPAPLRKFVLGHFLPMAEDPSIWLWGRRFEAAGPEPLDDTFLAVREGAYFIDRPEAAAGGLLTIDDRPVSDPVFHLRKGRHRIRFEGPADFAMLWLPRNELPWRPAPHPVRE